VDESAAAYEVVYREAIRALDLQRSSFDSLRARVGFLLSAATIATSFLGGLALRQTSDAGSWVAVALFVGFGAVSLRLLWPRLEGAEGFSAKPSVVIDEYLEPAEGVAQELFIIYRDLALFAEEAHDYNRDEHLKPLTNYFRLAITLLMAEIVAWVVDLAIRKDASHGEASSDRFHQSDAAVSGRREAAEIGSVSVLNG